MNKEESEHITAMAYKIGREIEQFILSNVGEIKTTNRVLEAKILGFRTIIKGWPGFLEQYDEYFDVQKLY